MGVLSPLLCCACEQCPVLFISSVSADILCREHTEFSFYLIFVVRTIRAMFRVRGAHRCTMYRYPFI
jgi:hypothetical protein